MNEDLSACWTRFCLEEFPVRRFLCELFFSRVFCTCDFNSCCVLVLACLLGISDPVELLLYVYVHDSAEMLFILFKDFNCFLFIPLSCFIFMFFFSFPITGNIVLTLPDYKTKPVHDLFNASLTVQQL